MLTKTDYLTYLQCPKALWLYRYHPELATPPDEANQRRMRIGQQVDMAARNLFPNGHPIPYRPQPAERVRLTLDAIASGAKVLFQPTFSTDDLLVIADILVRRDDSWHILEVKASTQVKKEHLPDLAYQRYVLEQSGLRIAGASLLHLNSACISPNPDIFLEAKQGDDLKPYLANVAADIPAMRRIVASATAPDNDIGRHCSRPARCAFYEHCWQGVDGLTIFHIPRLTPKREQSLRAAGALYLHEIPPDADLTNTQRAYVDFHTGQKIEIDHAAICRALANLEYPLYFFDFEAIDYAIPPFEGCRPYQQVPFQYSCHILHDDGRLEHREFLHTTADDPRPPLVHALLHDIGEQGTIIAYNISFEKGILLHLAERFPEHAACLQDMVNRLWDQLLIFRQYYHDYRFRGSNSLKSVLPVLVPELSYKSLEVQNGAQAQVAWETMITETDERLREEQIQHLLEYCRLDTLAMVEIHHKLTALCEQADR
ncbi:DUF2779 domain-containing protein [Candidatus Parcubacteria bacterium]|nr:MAG: DUF2779 domain-containing protein [Candidatus Parcubacteria bacterium]